MKMDKMTALLYLRRDNAPTEESLRDQVIYTFVTILKDGLALGDDFELVLSHQIEAYQCLANSIAEYDTGNAYDTVSGTEAEQIFLKESLRGLKQGSRDARHQNGIDWPEFMNINARYFPQLLADLAYIVGYQDGTERVAMLEYAKSYTATATSEVSP